MAVAAAIIARACTLRGSTFLRRRLCLLLLGFLPLQRRSHQQGGGLLGVGRQCLRERVVVARHAPPALAGVTSIRRKRGGAATLGFPAVEFGARHAPTNSGAP